METFCNQLMALERAINHLEATVICFQSETIDNFEQHVFNDLRASCARMTDEKIRFITIVNEARQGHFYAPPDGGGESPTP